MTWAQIGWVLIALAAVLLLVLSFLFKGRCRYPARQKKALKAFLEERLTAVERGTDRQIVLGDRFWSRAYPALGLHALAVLPRLARPENLADGGQSISAGTGELIVFARQIVHGNYQDGFSEALPVSLPGPTPFSFLAGFISEVGQRQPGSAGFLGNYGATAALMNEAVAMQGGHTFAAAGSISAQAALFLNHQALLIGEEVFMLPGLIEPTPHDQAGWVTEDILRVLLMVVLVVAAGLKMAGVI